MYPKSIDFFKSHGGNYPVMTKEEEVECAIRHLAGDKSATDRLVLCNIKFVVKRALRYKGYCYNTDELIQEGVYGLLKAIKKFDPNRGVRLVYYAQHWIDAYIRKYIIDNYSFVKVGTIIEERTLFFKIRNLRDKLERKENREVSQEQLAQEYGLDIRRVRGIEARIGARDLSLNAPCNGTNTEFIKIIADESQNVYNMVERYSNNKRIRDAINNGIKDMNEREKIVFNSRFMTADPPSCTEIGNTLGISRERVRQIGEVALNKIKKYIDNAEEVM